MKHVCVNLADKRINEGKLSKLKSNYQMNDSKIVESMCGFSPSFKPSSFEPWNCCFLICHTIENMVLGWTKFLRILKPLQNNFSVKILIHFLEFFAVYGDFLINGANCKIPNMNPFAKEAMKVFKRVKYEPCSAKRPLTSVDQNLEKDTAMLLIHDGRKSDYLSWWHKELKVWTFFSHDTSSYLKQFIIVLLPTNYSCGLQRFGW